MVNASTQQIIVPTNATCLEGICSQAWKYVSVDPPQLEPMKKYKAIITCKLSVINTPIKSIKANKVIPIMRKRRQRIERKETHFLPTLSAIEGTTKQAIAHPAKYIEPRRPTWVFDASTEKK